MLALRRREGEYVEIVVPPGSETRRLRVYVHRVEDDRSRALLGFDAPPDCVVIRNELVDTWVGWRGGGTGRA